MEDKLNIVANGRQPQYFSNGRRPQLFGKWKMTSIFSKWKITQLFWQIEDNIGTAQPQLVFASIKKCQKHSLFEIEQYHKSENVCMRRVCTPKACGPVATDILRTEQVSARAKLNMTINLVIRL